MTCSLLARHEPQSSSLLQLLAVMQWVVALVVPLLHLLMQIWDALNLVSEGLFQIGSLALWLVAHSPGVGFDSFMQLRLRYIHLCMVCYWQGGQHTTEWRMHTGWQALHHQDYVICALQVCWGFHGPD